MRQSGVRPGGMRPARGPNSLALAAQGDFFICDMPWAVPKDDMASMEHPLFTLATRPDRRILRYEHGDALIEINLHEQGNQFRRFVYVDAVLAGAGNDFFRDHSAAFGDDSWRCVGLAVGEGDCAL